MQQVIFKKSCPPYFELAKLNRIPLAIPVLKPEYENIPLSLSHCEIQLLDFYVNFDRGIPDSQSINECEYSRRKVPGSSV